jgi:hypothetical protein
MRLYQALTMFLNGSPLDASSPERMWSRPPMAPGADIA